MKIKLILLFIGLSLNFYSSSQIVINEVCSKNNSLIFDFEDDFEDWIEIKNQSSSTINLNNYFLSDDANNLIKWQMPNYLIEADSFLIIFASDKNININNEFHSNFKISASGETLYLTDLSLNNVDSLVVPKLLANNSYGKVNNQNFYFDVPTPNLQNDTANYFFGYASKPILNLPSGFYNFSLNAYITNYDSTQNYTFTKNGNYPTLIDENFIQNSTIDSSTVISVRAFKNNYLPSEIANHTYFINDSSHYAVVSLVFPPEYFFGDDGLYVYGDSLTGNNIYKDIRKKVFIDYFDEDKNLHLKNFFEAKLHGGSSKIHDMKSIRITARDKYGKSRIENVFFEEERNVEDYKSIILRNGGTDFNKTFLRDVTYQKHLLKNKIDNVYLQNEKPVLVYLNGNYWGIHRIRERFTEHFFADLHNVKTDEINYLENNKRLLHGNDSAWLALANFAFTNNLAIQNNYNIIDSFLNINSLIDNIIIGTYANNLDWPHNNIKFFNTTNNSQKFTYALIDFDAGLNSKNENDYTQDKLGAILFDEFTIVNATSGNRMDSLTHVKLFKGLLQNHNFKNNFVNRYCDLLNTVFISEDLINTVNNYKSVLDLEIDRHIQKWQQPGTGVDYWWNWYLNNLTTFYANRDSTAKVYLQQNLNLDDSIHITLNSNYTDSLNFDISTITIKAEEWTGFYFENIPINIAVDTLPNHSFLHWQLNFENGDSLIIDSLKFTYTFDENTTATAIFDGVLNIDTNNYNMDTLYNYNDTTYNDTLYNYNDTTYNDTLYNYNDTTYNDTLYNYNDTTYNDTMYNYNDTTYNDTLTNIFLYDESNYLIYPNPVKNWLQFNFIFRSIEKLEIYNMAGQKIIYHTNFTGSKINLSHLKNGNYFIKFYFNNKQSISKKFIKTN